MKKRVVGYSAGLAGLLIMSAALAGCSGKVTAEKVLKKVEKSMEDVTSYQMDTLVDADGNLSMSGMSFDFSISMDMKSEIWNSDSRNVNHTTGSMKVNVLGNDVSEDMESYTVTEDGKATEYVQESGSWYYMVADADTSDSSGDYFLDDASRWTLAEDPVDITTSESHSCYELTTSIGADDWNSLQDNAEMQQFFGAMGGGVGESGDDSIMNEMQKALQESSIPMVLYVDIKTNQPVRFTLDMQDVMDAVYTAMFTAGEDDLAAAGLEDLSVELPMKMTMDFSRFNEVGEITLPDDVKNAEEYSADNIEDAISGILTDETAAEEESSVEASSEASSGISAIVPKKDDTAESAAAESSQAVDSAAQTGERTYIIHSDYTDDQYQIDWPEGYEIQQEEGDLIAIANMINSNTAIFYLEEKSLFTEDDMKAAIADSASYWKDDEDVTNFSTGELQTTEYNGRTVVYDVSEYTYGGNTDYICYDGYLEAGDSYLQFSYDLMTSNSTKDLTPFLQWITIPGDTHQA